MIAPEDAFAPFDVVPSSECKPEPELFSGRKTNVDQIDLDLVKSWVRSCDHWHGPECTGGTPSSSGLPEHFSPFIRLLDLDEDHLVKLREPGPYLAPSYVWGRQEEVFKTLGNTIEELEVSGGLSAHQGRFPNSIQDAIALIKVLRYRFLWIDSLCIIQDSVTDKSTQLAAMDLIYTLSTLTIVAASGDNANAGLAGLRRGSGI
ncbi:putative Heterokaryon incompatibility domain-containing protein [Seiridium cardinale]|uniref:Heterokaryon incompatibility domain-containing protein n=1 Tax=Seiridium cardinale TaxID=138064 RepID=A0ABR2XMW8_9PEZI